MQLTDLKLHAAATLETAHLPFKNSIKIYSTYLCFFRVVFWVLDRALELVFQQRTGLRGFYTSIRNLTEEFEICHE